MNSRHETNLWTKISRRHLLLLAVSALLSAFGLFDLIYSLYGFQPILFWANDLLLISSSAAIFLVILVSVEYSNGEHDLKLNHKQDESKKVTERFIHPLGIGKIAQSALGNKIHPLPASAINMIQWVGLAGIASYYLGIWYGKPEDIKVTIFMVFAAAILLAGFVVLEKHLWSKRVWNTENSGHSREDAHIRSVHPGSLHSLGSSAHELSGEVARGGISRTDFISLLEKVILSDEFKTGQDD